MVSALDPVYGFRNRFSRIYGSHLKDYDRASTINRAWTGIFAVLVLSLGIAFLIGCSSDTTRSTHLVSVNTTQLIWDITNNSTLVNDTSSDAKSNLLNTYQRIQPRVPSEYLFGMSGCCRVYENGSRHCIKAFPQSIDILTTIIKDLNENGNSSINPTSIIGPNFSSMQQSYIATSKAYTAIMITCMAWTVITAFFVMIFAHKSALHLIATLPGALLAVGSAGVLTWCVIIQMAAYELSDSYAAISLGPGLFIMWSWMICLMLLTPLTTMISIIVVVCIILLIIWIIFLCMVCVLVCIGSGGSDPDRWDNPNYPNSTPYNPDTN